MELIELLADGAWHAGPQLAGALGVSRAAVWKKVRAARGLGLTIHAVRGRGYRLPGAFVLLDAGAIRAGLSAAGAAELEDLSVAGSVDSTSSRLLAAPHAGAGRGCRALFAEHQSSGRGRRGRQWVSPYGANLYFSVARALDPAPPAIGALGLAVGVGLAEALQGLGVAAIGLKWPNDLVVDGAKLGGILIDHQGEAAGYCRIVVGVGINVTMAPEQAREVDQPWASLAGVLGRSPDRNALAAACLDAVLDALRGYAAGGFTAFRARWQRYDVLQDRPVWLESAAGREAGRAVGIAADGALLVAMRSGVRHCYAGDVSVRDTGP